MRNPITKVHSIYGAPMGRASNAHPGHEPTSRFSIRRIRINSGGYDSGGAYWGIGQPLYWYCAETTDTVACGNCEWCERGTSDKWGKCPWGPNEEHVYPTRTVPDEISDFVRADDREHVKAIVLRKYPTATFYR